VPVSFGRINLMLALALLVVMAAVGSAADHPTATTPLPPPKTGSRPRTLS
jgi:hypothetical protein